MAKFNDCVFTGERLPLDGNEYVGCTFSSCILVYSATGPVGLHNSTINNSNFEFTGAAANTLQFLKAIYGGLGEWGKTQVLLTLEAIAPDLKKMN